MRALLCALLSVNIFSACGQEGDDTISDEASAKSELPPESGNSLPVREDQRRFTIGFPKQRLVRLPLLVNRQRDSTEDGVTYTVDMTQLGRTAGWAFTF